MGELVQAATRVLLVDDDATIARPIEQILRHSGFSVDVASDGERALQAIELHRYDVMILDLRMGNLDGLDVLRALGSLPDAPCTILHSAYLDVPTTVAAMRYGVEDVFEKPMPSTLLVDRVRELARKRRPTRVDAPGALRGDAESPRLDPVSRILGETPAIRALRRQIERISAFREVPILIEGETGTGKELIAEAIHALTVPDEPFVAVNCAAIPADLFESELFGHEAGAFTSARGHRVGLLEEARRGTIFLDEIGEMPPSVQPKLLRVLETREFRRLGGARRCTLGARVVSATNRSLRRADDGFRSDLYFRIAGWAIVSPPLRQRASDIPILAREFLARFAARHRVTRPEITEAALDSLRSHEWPGNVRELRLVVENAAMLASPRAIVAQDVDHILASRGRAWTGGVEAEVARPGPTIRKVAPTLPDGLSLPDAERELIIQIFSECSRNMTWTAKRLGIPRSTLRDRLRKFGLR